MALILREVQNVMWWSVFREAAEDWLPDSECRGDALKSLRSTDCSLSIFRLEEDSTEQMERMLAAFAAQRGRAADLDFAILAEPDFIGLGLRLANAPGKTPDSVVNSWHRNIVELSASRIQQLAMCLQSQATFCRKREKDVLRLVKNSLAAGHIAERLVQPKLLAEIRVSG